MTLQPHEADQNDPDDRQLVAVAALRMQAVAGSKEAHPILVELAEGRWPESVTVCFVGDELDFYGVVVVEDDPAAQALKAIGVQVDETLPTTHTPEVLLELVGYVIVRAVTERRKQLLFMANGMAPELAIYVQGAGFTQSAGGFGASLDDMLRAGDPRGCGRWAVILHNDEVTTMDAVIHAIRLGVGVREGVAWAMMSKVHVHGAATVSLHWFRWGAMRAKKRMDAIFKRAGFDTRVEVACELPTGRRGD